MLDRDLHNGRCVKRSVPALAELSVDVYEWYGDEEFTTKSSASSNCGYCRRNSCSHGAQRGLVLKVDFDVTMRCSMWWL